jgi:outer membrane lipoprotein-sorting protein
MRIGLSVVPFTFFLCSAASADSLDATLTRLDHAGSQFKGMTADFANVKYTAVVNEKSPPNEGKIAIKKKGPGEILGRLDFIRPDEKLVLLLGQTVDIFLPQIRTMQEADLGKHKGLLEQFFLIGFGTAKSDLVAAYTVSLGGTETINGEPTTRLELVSKKPEINRQVSKFELWISDKTGEPVQQKFYEPSGDYNVFTYSNMKINPNLPDSELEKHPKGYKKEMLNK